MFRTTRGDSQGTALSLISAQELPLLQQAETALSGDTDDPVIKPYRFKMEEIEGFRYRAKVTKIHQYQGLTVVSVCVSNVCVCVCMCE